MKNFEAIGSAPEEGVYLHGLTMDGGDWDLKAGILVESIPKILFTPLPVLFVSANHKREQDKVPTAAHHSPSPIAHRPPPIAHRPSPIAHRHPLPTTHHHH